MEPVTGVAGLLLSALGNMSSAALEKLIDPAINEALNPATGLLVSPLYFQSVEQEGRWKNDQWGFEKLRNLTGPLDKNKLRIPNPGVSSIGLLRQFVGQKPGDQNASPQKLSQFQRPLLTISVNNNFNRLAQSGMRALDALKGIAGRKTVVPTEKQASDVVTSLAGLAAESILPSTAVIDATWVSDGLEIWGGFAGLSWATGFGSVYGHRARIDIGGTVMGNYLPSAYLLGLTGYVNPVGPNFIEFRCAVIVSANDGIFPLYGSSWSRESNKKPQDLTKNYDPNQGFVIDLKS